MAEQRQFAAVAVGSTAIALAYGPVLLPLPAKLLHRLLIALNFACALACTASKCIANIEICD